MLRPDALDELIINPPVGISHMDFGPTNLKSACNEKQASPIDVNCNRFGLSIFVYAGGGYRLLHVGEPWAECRFGSGESFLVFCPRPH